MRFPKITCILFLGGEGGRAGVGGPCKDNSMLGFMMGSPSGKIPVFGLCLRRA